MILNKLAKHQNPLLQFNLFPLLFHPMKRTLKIFLAETNAQEQSLSSLTLEHLPAILFFKRSISSFSFLISLSRAELPRARAEPWRDWTVWVDSGEETHMSAGPRQRQADPTAEAPLPLTLQLPAQLQPLLFQPPDPPLIGFNLQAVLQIPLHTLVFG